MVQQWGVQQRKLKRICIPDQGIQKPIKIVWEMVTLSTASRTDNWGFVELAICCYTKILNESQGIHTKIGLL